MTAPQLVFRRNFRGKLTAAVEYGEVRVSKIDKPVERYVLTPDQEKLPISQLVVLAQGGVLAKWAAPAPAAKTVTERNKEMAAKGTLL